MVAPFKWVAAVEPSYPLVTVQVVVATFVTSMTSVSIEMIKSTAGNDVSDVTVMLVPLVSVMAAAKVVVAKFLWLIATAYILVGSTILIDQLGQV